MPPPPRFARIFRHLFIAILIGGAASAGYQLTSPPPPALPVNLLIFSIDTLRADRLGCNGNRRGLTPHLDALAGDAVNFTAAFSQAPWTAPSHMTMFTGLMPPVHGIANFSRSEGDTRPLPPRIMPLAGVLRASGYRTGAFTEDIHVGRQYGFATGFDFYHEDFFERQGMIRDAAGGEARHLARLQDQLANWKQSPAPWFLFLHHYLCHEIYVAAPAAYRRRFLHPAPRPLLDGPEDISDWNNSYNEFWQALPAADPACRQRASDLYDASVAYSDHLIGRLVAMLKAGDAYDRTLLVVLGDHGEEFYEHNGNGHGRLFREHLHVPLLIKLPGQQQGGTTVTQPVRLVDLMPTLLELLGLEAPPVPAVSFAGLCTGRETPYAPELVSYATEAHDTGTAVAGIRLTRDGFIYLRGRNEGERLFAASDTAELTDLSGSFPARLQQFRAAAAARLQDDATLHAWLISAPASE